MEKQRRLHLFQGYGVEVEYMIVDRDTLDVKPIADELLKKVAGPQACEYVNGSVTWSNELALHVIELKCTEPVQDLFLFMQDLAANIQEIDQHLREFNAQLMPSSAHPWMDPKRETLLWPHGQSQIYETYNRIFDCQGHGWSNLQSTHINLPFYDDEEFAALHEASRLILPLIPAIAASSPIMEGQYTGYHDKRMIYYEKNQQRIPSVTGRVIPESYSSRRQYQKHVYDKIRHDKQYVDPEDILDPVWLNSRGIIPRFDRGSLEIRIIDTQECPSADLAIVALVTQVIRMIMRDRLFLQTHHGISTERLYDILQKTVKSGHRAIIADRDYLRTLGIEEETTMAGAVWAHLFGRAEEEFPHILSPWTPSLDHILHQGTLAQRIVEAVDGKYDRASLRVVYAELSANLLENRLFEPCDLSISL